MNSKTLPSWPLRTQLSSELSVSGRSGYSLPRSSCKGSAPQTSEQLKRKNTLRFPELSELDVVRHFTRLSHLNYSIDGGFYPLGSCTMKYNPRVNEVTSNDPRFAMLHPLTPDHLAQGALELMFHLENLLATISGFARVTLQPGAGAQGEYTGIQMIRACLASRGDVRKKLLIPESAHGTNAATATLCGYEAVPIKTNSYGLVSLEQIEELTRSGDVAGIMITNPNTLGLFESDIAKICKLVHDSSRWWRPRMRRCRCFSNARPLPAHSHSGARSSPHQRIQTRLRSSSEHW